MMICDIFNLILKTFDKEITITDTMCYYDGQKYYVNVQNLNLELEQNVKIRSYLSGAADQQNTKTIVKALDLESGLNAEFIIENTLIGTRYYGDDYITIIDNKDSFQVSLSFEQTSININSENSYFIFDDKETYLCIDKTGNGNKNNILSIYLRKSLPDEPKSYNDMNKKQYIEAYTEPHKISFSKYKAYAKDDRFADDAYYKVDAINLENDTKGIFATEETIKNYYPEFYNTLNDILTSSNDLLPNLLSITSNLTDEEFKALYGIDKSSSLEDTKELVKKKYKWLIK